MNDKILAELFEKHQHAWHALNIYDENERNLRDNKVLNMQIYEEDIGKEIEIEKEDNIIETFIPLTDMNSKIIDGKFCYIMKLKKEIEDDDWL